jgi:hypothetical protein
MRKEKNAGFASCRHACRLCVSKWPPHQCRGTKRLRLDASSARGVAAVATNVQRSVSMQTSVYTQSTPASTQRAPLAQCCGRCVLCGQHVSTAESSSLLATTTPRGMAEGARLQARTHVAGRKGMQARAHGSPTRLRAPAARRGLNAQQPLAAPVQGWCRVCHCPVQPRPAPCPVRPPPSALRSFFVPTLPTLFPTLR